MFIVDAGYILEESGGEYAPHQWSDENKIPWKRVVKGTISGASALGDHGPDWKPESTRPTEAEAILDCGHKIQFTVAPITGESLYCSRCDSWEKCRVPGGLLVGCNTCGLPPEGHFGHNYTLAMARARKHAYGSHSQRKHNPHVALIGKYTIDGVTWMKYEKGMEL